MSIPKKYLLVCIAPLLLLSFVNKGNSNGGKYLKEIRAYYAQMAKLTQPVEGKVFHFSYVETFESWNKSEGKMENTANIYLTKNKFYYYSDKVDIFQDSEDVFMILKEQKKIYRTNSIIKTNYQEQLDNYIKIQDFSFEKGKVLLSDVVKLNGKSYARITLQLPEELKEKVKVKRTTYWYDIEAKSIWKVKVDYQKGYKIKSRSTIFKTLDLNHGKKMKKSVFKKVVNKKGQLLSEYQNYELINNKE